MAYSDGYAGGYAGPVVGDSQFQYLSIPWGQLETTIHSLEPGNSYEIAVAAYDHAGRTNGFSTPVTVVTATDASAPGTPAPPTLTQGVLEITVSHTLGLASGGTYNLDSDLAELEVHISTSSGFTPSASTKIAALKADNSNLVTQRPVAVTIPVTDTATRYFKVIAVDKSGNQSGPSGEVSQTPTLVTSTQIVNRTIQSLDIGLDQIVSELIASRSIFANHLYVADFDNLIYNPGAEANLTLTPHAPHVSASGGGTWTVDASTPNSGANAWKYDMTGQTGKARFVLNVSDGDAPSNPDQLIAMKSGGWLASILSVACQSATAANDAGIAFVWYDETLSLISETEQLNTAVSTTYTDVELMAQAPATAAYAAVELRVANEGNSNPIFFDDVLVRRALEGNLIVDGTIEGNHLSSVTIEVAKHIESTNFVTGVSGWRIPGDDTLAAEFNNVVVRGTVYATAGEIGGLSVVDNVTLGVGGVFRTAASGQRVEMSSVEQDRINFYSGDAEESTPGLITASPIPGAPPGIQYVITGPMDTTDVLAFNQIVLYSKSANTAGIRFTSTKQDIAFGLGGAAYTGTFMIGEGQGSGPSMLTLDKTKINLTFDAATNGTTIFSLDTANPVLDVIRRGDGDADFKFSGQVMLDGGSAANPCLVIDDADLDTGFFHTVDADTIGISTGGTKRLEINTVRFDLNQNLTFLRLPVKTTTGHPSSPGNGDMYVNTFDNGVFVYADAAWRSLASW